MLAFQLVEEQPRRPPPVHQEKEDTGMKSFYSSCGSRSIIRRPKQSLMTRTTRTRSVASAPSPRKEGGRKRGGRERNFNYARLRYVDIVNLMRMGNRTVLPELVIMLRSCVLIRFYL